MVGSLDVTRTVNPPPIWSLRTAKVHGSGPSQKPTAKIPEPNPLAGLKAAPEQGVAEYLVRQSPTS